MSSSIEFIVESLKWLKSDNHVRHVTTCELGRCSSRLVSCLGEWVIDTMVGMDKDSSSAFPFWIYVGDGLAPRGGSFS